MIHGITPIDTAFEMMGLHQAQALVRFIFIESLAGKFVFALGFIMSLAASLAKANFRPVLVFVFLFFTLWIVCVMPASRAVVPVSAMEQAGYHDVSTAALLEKNGYGQIMVSPPLGLVSQWIDALIRSMITVLDRVDGARSARGYAASPFLFTKVSILTSSLVASGITDPVLENKSVHFYQDYFWPAVHDFPQSSKDLWPGDPDVIALYSEDGRVAWESLRDEIYVSMNQDNIFDRMFARFYDGRVDKDAVVRSVLARELQLKPARYTLMSYASRKELWHEKPVNAGLWDIVMPARIMQALPFVQGGALLLIYGAWPFFLVMAILTRSAMVLVIFLGIVVSVKSWTLGWAVVDKVSMAWFVAFGMREGVWMWQASSVNGWIACAAGLTPVVITCMVAALVLRMRTGQKTATERTGV